MNVDHPLSFLCNKLLWVGLGVGVAASYGATSVLYGNSIEKEDDSWNLQLMSDQGKPMLGEENEAIKDIPVPNSKTARTFSSKELNCFQEFFPGALENGNFKLTESEESRNSTEIPSVDFSKPLLGCKTAKFSRTTDGQGFIYKSSITVKTKDNKGFALFSGSTNLKSSLNKSDSEFRLVFLEKESSSWKITHHFAWEVSFTPSTPSSPVFQTTFPSASGRKASRRIVYSRGTDTEGNEDLTSFYDSHKKRSDWLHTVFYGIWVPANLKGIPPMHIIEGGSVERWGIRQKFEPSSIKPTPSFFNQIKLTRTGSWLYDKDYCSSKTRPLDFCKLDIPTS